MKMLSIKWLHINGFLLLVQHLLLVLVHSHQYFLLYIHNFLMPISKNILYGNIEMIKIQTFANNLQLNYQNIRADKLRRVTLFDRLNQELKINQQQLEAATSVGSIILSKFIQPQLDSIPTKYIKFGEYTPYIFHTTVKEGQIQIEQSHLFLTPFFESYMKLTKNFLTTIKGTFESIQKFRKNYLQYRKDYKKNKELYDEYLFIDTDHLLKFKDVRNQQVFNQTKRAEVRIRRILELLRYHSTGDFLMNGFTFSDWTHFYKHVDLLETQIYNSETNKADIGLFYSLVAIPKFFQFLIRRKISM